MQTPHAPTHTRHVLTYTLTIHTEIPGDVPLAVLDRDAAELTVQLAGNVISDHCVHTQVAGPFRGVESARHGSVSALPVDTASGRQIGRVPVDELSEAAAPDARPGLALLFGSAVQRPELPSPRLQLRHWVDAAAIAALLQAVDLVVAGGFRGVVAIERITPAGGGEPGELWLQITPEDDETSTDAIARLLAGLQASETLNAGSAEGHEHE